MPLARYLVNTRSVVNRLFTCVVEDHHLNEEWTRIILLRICCHHCLRNRQHVITETALAKYTLTEQLFQSLVILAQVVTPPPPPNLPPLRCEVGRCATPLPHLNPHAARFNQARIPWSQLLHSSHLNHLTKPLPPATYLVNLIYVTWVLVFHWSFAAIGVLPFSFECF